MRNTVDIDRTQCRAINREIGETLRTLLSLNPEMPQSLRTHLDRFRGAEDHQSASIVPTMRPWDLS
jgi:hypothetical protein